MRRPSAPDCAHCGGILTPLARPAWLAGQPWRGFSHGRVEDKWTGEWLAPVALADPDTFDVALGSAQAARAPMRAMPAHRRAEVLRALARGVQDRRDDFVAVLVAEAGKTSKDAGLEVGRAVDTFQLAGDVAARGGSGPVMDLGTTRRGEGSWAFIRRVPVGVCALISPFNFPLNLVAHKVGPAIAAGCPFVLKPASTTPGPALLLGELLARLDLPEGSWSILPASREAAERLVVDPKVALLSFTGSAEVGWAMKARAGNKRVLLELGGNAAVVVDDTWDPNDAAERIVAAAFGQAGQSCISVQRILVQRRGIGVLRDALIARIDAMEVRDRLDPQAALAPMIAQREADRVRMWVSSAVRAGASAHSRDPGAGRIVWPTLLMDVPPTEPLWCEEAFGPVACLAPFDTFDEALSLVNDGRFGLQVGLLSRDLPRAMAAWEHADVGGVVAGDVPTWRADDMPYGGVKDSGLGREGLAVAVEEMTEPRVLVVRPTTQAIKA